MMNAQIPKDFMVWWKNPNPDVELDQDNSLRPFYLVIQCLANVV
jgi:hypothetical protein